MLKVCLVLLILGVARGTELGIETNSSDTEVEIKVTTLGAEEQTEEEGSSSGGQITSIEDYPYVVSIDGNVSCTGVIVDSRYVFTTLVCLDKTEPTDENDEDEDEDEYDETKSTIPQKEATVRVGSDFSDKDGQVKKLKWVYDHPFSDIMPDTYGFVMAELQEPLVENSEFTFERAVFSSLHDPRKERTNELVKRGAVCTIVGYSTSHSDLSSHAGALHQTPVKLLPWSACNDADVEVQPEFEICAALPAYHSNLCVNDEGAPLVCNNKVYGVLVGYNETCGVSLNRPARFLRTDQAMDFITLIRDCVDASDCYKPHMVEF